MTGARTGSRVPRIATPGFWPASGGHSRRVSAVHTPRSYRRTQRSPLRGAVFLAAFGGSGPEGPRTQPTVVAVLWFSTAVGRSVGSASARSEIVPVAVKNIARPTPYRWVRGPSGPLPEDTAGASAPSTPHGRTVPRIATPRCFWPPSAAAGRKARAPSVTVVAVLWFSTAVGRSVGSASARSGSCRWRIARPVAASRRGVSGRLRRQRAGRPAHPAHGRCRVVVLYCSWQVGGERIGPQRDRAGGSKEHRQADAVSLGARAFWPAFRKTQPARQRRPHPTVVPSTPHGRRFAARFLAAFGGSGPEGPRTQRTVVAVLWFSTAVGRSVGSASARSEIVPVAVKNIARPTPYRWVRGPSGPLQEDTAGASAPSTPHGRCRVVVLYSSLAGRWGAHRPAAKSCRWQ